MQIIALIDQKIGDLLRQLSGVVEEPVKALFQGNLDPDKTYAMEQIQSSKLLDSPRTLDHLGTLISGTHT